INAWRIDENRIDYVEGEPAAGVINHPDRYPQVTADLIASLNEKGGEKNITAGFHAIEFLLWGQDLNDDGPGRRSFRDYVDGQAPHADRRRAYLRAAAQLLVADVTTLVDEWRGDRPSNYRARVRPRPPPQAI